MKRLILLRHAKTERRSASGEDIDRALTAEGHADAAAVGRALAAAGLIADLALVSTALRARETFEAMAPSLPDIRIETRADLYNATSDALHQAAEAAQADTVLVVAHNPGVHALAHSLAQDATMIGVADREAIDQGYPTATAAAFEFLHGRTGCLGVFGPQGRVA